jgi:hypothetical protein
MRFRTPRIVVIGLLLGLTALEARGETAAGSAPTWLTAPDLTQPERVLWEGVAVPLKEAQLKADIEEGKQLEARLREGKLSEAERRAVIEEAEVLEAYLWRRDNINRSARKHSRFVPTLTENIRALKPTILENGVFCITPRKGIVR